jgi:uncharacterized protein YcfL
VINRSEFSYTSFCHPVLNWLRKSNQTTWVTVEGQLFWYNGSSVQVNSHLFDKII